MAAIPDSLLQQVLVLPDDSKLLLAEELIASVETAGDADDAVVERRRAEFLAGTATLIPAEEALRQVRAELVASASA